MSLLVAADIKSICRALQFPLQNFIFFIFKEKEVIVICIEADFPAIWVKSKL